MTHENHTEIIEQYINGELTGEVLQHFEKELKENNELAAEYILQKEIRATLSDKDIMELRDTLHEISRKHAAGRKAKARNRVLVYSIGVTVVVVITVLYICFVFDNKPDNKEVFAMYYCHVDASPVKRGPSETIAEPVVAAFAEYDRGKYTEAIDMFNRIADTSQYYYVAKYYSGLAYIELKKYNEAITPLAIVEKDKENFFAEDAGWHIALCYLALDNKEKATELLNQIITKDKTYRKQAEEILRML